MRFQAYSVVLGLAQWGVMPIWMYAYCTHASYLKVPPFLVWIAGLGGLVLSCVRTAVTAIVPMRYSTGIGMTDYGMWTSGKCIVSLSWVKLLVNLSKRPS